MMKFLAILILLLPLSLKAQKKPNYVIYDYPVSVKAETIDSLNRVIARKITYNEVFALVNERLKRYQDELVSILRPNSPVKERYVDLWIGNPSRKNIRPGNVKAGRSDERIQVRQQFSQLLRDTIYVINKFSINVDLTDPSLPINNYYIEIKSGVEKFKLPLTNSGNKILQLKIPDHLSRLQPKKLLACSLFNLSDTNPLSKFYLAFLNHEEVEEITDQYEILKELNGGAVDDEFSAEFMREYVRERFGNVPMLDVRSWLKQLARDSQ